MSFVGELTWRGLLHQATDLRLEARMNAEPFTFYVGFDPTAESLHVGSLLQIVAMMRAQRGGHKPIAVVGGATGMVGDPSGKSEERKLLDDEHLQRNLAGIRAQLERFLDFSGASSAKLVNNYDWFKGIGYLEFLRDVGKHFSVNMMVAKESVRARLEDRDQGISYTEFSYMLLQAYDYLWLHDHYGCKLQFGGSDQWGNITAGIELIRRMRGAEAFGLTLPLITTASGAKFGKTEKGAVWLDTKRTSTYEFYQFFVNTDDRDVGKFLRYYTFLDKPMIEELEKKDPATREAHRVLAREVTTMVHGAEEAAKAEAAAQALFSSGGDDLKTILSQPNVPQSTIEKARLEGGLPLVSLIAEVKLAPSTSAARRDVSGGGVYLNGERITDIDRKVTMADLKDGEAIVLRKGKRSYHVVKIG